MRVLALLGLLLVVATLAAPLRAHGGDVVFAGVAGPYRILSRALLGGGWVDYSMEISDAVTGLPVTDATVMVTALTPDGRLGPWEAFAGGALYEMVERAPDEIRWELQVSIDGPRGPATLSHRLELGGSNWIWASAAMIGAFVAVIGTHWFVSRRRRSRRARTGAAG